MKSISSHSFKSLTTKLKGSDTSPVSSLRSFDGPLCDEKLLLPQHEFAARVEKALEHDVCGPLSSRQLKLSAVPFSSLASQLRTRVLESGGYFLSGKFGDGTSTTAASTTASSTGSAAGGNSSNSSGGGEAYSGLAMAMEDFAEQILERDWDKAIRNKLHEFLQGNETVLLDVFPALQTVLSSEEDSTTEETQQDNKADDQEQAIATTPNQAGEESDAGYKRSEESRDNRSKRRVFFFQQFFHAVLSASSSGHKQSKKPCIVLVLDDVQWIGKASLDLLSSLVRDPDLGSFLLITTNRPIPPDHPNQIIPQQMDAWRTERVRIHEYALENLCISSVDDIVTACLDLKQQQDEYNHLDCQDSITFPLAQIIHQRTQGNPFFAVELLKALVDQQLLTFSYASMDWTWDIDKVYSLGMTMTDSPVDLLIAKVKRLPPNHQLILLISSCLGGTFKAPLIRKVLQSLNHPSAATTSNHDNKVCESDTDDKSILSLMTNNSNSSKNVPVLETLETFVQSGLLERNGKCFYFVHDIIRQAAKEFVSPEHLEWMRLRVGETILRGIKLSSSSTTSQDARRVKNETNLFLGVDLCNSALRLLGENQRETTTSGIEVVVENGNSHDNSHHLELLDLARYNLCSGEKAMRESAFVQAVRYFKTGIQILQMAQQQPDHANNNDRTTIDDELRAGLLSGAAEASYCSGNYEDMNVFAEQLLDRSDCPEEVRLRMLFFKVQSAAAQEFAHEALDIGYAAVQLLGMATFPRYPTPFHVLTEIIKTKRALRNHTLETLKELPVVTDTRRIAAMEFLNAMKGPAGVSNQNFLIVTFLKSVRWAVKYGLGKHSPGGFAVYGTILNAMFGEADSAVMFGDLALALAERMGVQETTAETSTLTFGMLRHWTSDMRSCYPPLVYAQKLALECGDIETVTFCFVFGSIILWCTALISLPEMGRHLQRQCVMCRDFKHWSMLEILTNLGIHLRRLCRGKEDHAFVWLDDPETSSLKSGGSAEKKPKANVRDPTIELFYDCMALQSHVLLEECREALDCAKRTYAMGTELCIGQAYVPRTQFYRGVIHLSCAAKHSLTSWKHLYEAKRALSLLKKWAKNGENNHNSDHMISLLDAELARIRNRKTKAKQCYSNSIAQAQESGHIQDAALGHKCAAEFYLAVDKDKATAAYHAEQAVRCFRSWGASAVAAQLEQRYETLLVAEDGASSLNSNQQ
ncbi:Protein tyrosine kinase [Seminavis robusta]|uniref:Protein tyrosine kinase n=1 Tax=Seminavis robusta TaxID=568900 RepID=A0A9N8HTK6_9STRA|nr:Protein tyrosine kinase [Seminavis robusta]|eukprot:Sro1604_g285400.1 Protein tyrosine kinase (1209) ;mRNA; f:22049-25840